MKKLLLLACLAILSITSFGQSFSGPTNSVASGTTITLTAVGESYDATNRTPYYYFAKINGLFASNITYPSYPPDAQQYITIGQPNVTNVYSPINQSPTTIKITVYNDNPTTPLTVSFKITTQYAYHYSSGATGVTGAVDLPFTITIAPGTGPAGTFYSAAYSKTFTRSNCTPGAIAGTHVYSVPKGFKNSTVSQSAADQAAIAYVNANGQSTANSIAPCVFENAYIAKNYTKNDCTTGTGSTFTYTIGAGMYQSTVSQAAVDQLVANDLNTNGQTSANQSGDCNDTFDIYAQPYSGVSYSINSNGNAVASAGGLCIKFSNRDIGGGIGELMVLPYSVSVTVNGTTYTVPAGVSSYLLQANSSNTTYVISAINKLNSSDKHNYYSVLEWD